LFLSLSFLVSPAAARHHRHHRRCVLRAAGDGILMRLHHHVMPLGLHCPEELNKDSGASQGAQDLTWSYGTVFGAAVARNKAVAAVQAL
jgi:hypothetical protein